MSTEPPDDLLQTRVSLVARLKDSDDTEIWQRFLATYGPLLQRVARQSGLTEPEVEDAVQETVISVARTMPGFKYDPSVCSFKSWLQHLARKRIADQFRKRRPTQASVPDTTSSTTPMDRVADPRTVDPDSVWEQEWQRGLFDAAVGRVKSDVDVEQFQIFDFYVLKSWPVKRVAATLGVSVARVYLAKHRVMRMVKREVRRLEKEGL